VGEALAPFHGQVVIATKFGEEVASRITAQGARYPEHLQQRVGR
jgi:aryl-alcohol dehydrogenase-like predicted oxidoreductase